MMTIYGMILEISHTNEKPTVAIKAKEIVLSFERAARKKWNILEASKRLGLFV